MNLDKVLTESRWEIVKSVSKRSLSPSQLAKKLKLSAANMSIQLRLLEALGLVASERAENSGVGKPKKMYHLKKEFANITLASEEICAKKFIRLGQFEKIIFNCLMINDNVSRGTLIRTFITYYAMLKDSTTITYLGRSEKIVNAIAVTDNKKEQVSSYLGDIDMTCNITFHSWQQIEGGLHNNDPYYIELIEKSQTIIDKNRRMSKLKQSRVYTE